jgi:hypothetical protein
VIPWLHSIRHPSVPLMFVASIRWTLGSTLADPESEQSTIECLLQSKALSAIVAMSHLSAESISPKWVMVARFG